MVTSTPFRAADFKSAYGPKYQYQPNFHGWDKTALLRVGMRTALFGGAGGIAAMFFVSGIPRVQKDILQKIPIIGQLFIKKEVHPADNPF